MRRIQPIVPPAIGSGRLVGLVVLDAGFCPMSPTSRPKKIKQATSFLSFSINKPLSDLRCRQLKAVSSAPPISPSTFHFLGCRDFVLCIHHNPHT
jgi:hypothetical protein